MPVQQDFKKRYEHSMKLFFGGRPMPAQTSRYRKTRPIIRHIWEEAPDPRTGKAPLHQEAQLERQELSACNEIVRKHGVQCVPFVDKVYSNATTYIFYFDNKNKEKMAIRLTANHSRAPYYVKGKGWKYDVNIAKWRKDNDLDHGKITGWDDIDTRKFNNLKNAAVFIDNQLFARKGIGFE